MFGHYDQSNSTGRARSHYGSVNGLDGSSDILANQEDTGQDKAATFEEPRVLILPKAHEIDLGKNSQTPHLDILQRGYKIERQSGAQQLWDAREFEREHGIKERAIVATLLGDKTSQVLPESLLKWFLLPVIYIRGSSKPQNPQQSIFFGFLAINTGKDLGETWFDNGVPANVVFYHSSYQPQYYPADDLEAASRKGEYLAIGEEWVSEESMVQLGITPRGKKDGRIYLDPTISYVSTLPS